MKFDVVIGNPPYQEDREGTRDKQIYPFFMDASYNIADISVLITPGRFLFNVGDTPKAWNRKMLNDSNLKVIFYEQDSKTIFKGTDIKGGVAITYRNTNKIVKPIGHFVHIPELISLLEKVEMHEGNLSDISYVQSSYSFSSSMHEENPKVFSLLSKGNENMLTSNILEKLADLIFFKDNNINETGDYVKIFGLYNRKRVYRWVKRQYLIVPKNFEKWKVFLPKSNGSGAIGEILSTPVIGKPYIGHTQTFMSMGNFKTESEAENCIKYLKTKFARTMLGIMKITQDNPPKVWEKVPLQNFTINSDIDWSMPISYIDQQLYKKYKLSQDEISFIVENVKEME